MKKLYFLDEEEKNRILNIHESATKKQYLSEDKVGDYWKTLDPTTSGKFAKINGAVNRAGTDEESFVQGVESLNKDEFNKLEELLKTIGMGGYKSFQDIVNGELGYDDLPQVIKIRAHLSKLGINSTYKFREKDKYGQKLSNPTFVDKSFVVGGAKPVTQQPVAKQPVTQQPVAKKPAVVDPKKAYQQRAQQVAQQTQTNTKQIQQSLGQEQTGTMDPTTVERLIDLLKQ